VANEVVHIQLMNNYPLIAAPTMSRFIGANFYPFTRADMAEVKRRTVDGDRSAWRDLTCDMWRAHGVLQLHLDTLQATGICVKVADEGWRALCVEVERVVKDHFPFALGGGLVMQRKLGDAFEFLRMLVNANAIFLTFFHPRAEHGDLSNVQMSAFRAAERLTVPSDEAMYHAISFTNDDLFPPAELRVGRALMAMLRSSVAAAAEDGEMLLHETPLNQLKEEMRAGDDYQPPPAPARRGEPRPWRSRAAQFQRLLSLKKGATRRGPRPWRSRAAPPPHPQRASFSGTPSPACSTAACRSSTRRRRTSPYPRRSTSPRRRGRRASRRST